MAVKLEFPLLGLLAVHRTSGYEIKKWLDTEGQFLGLDRHASQIYRELNRMYVDGSIDFDVDPRGGGPDAKLYRVTDEGMRRLHRWVYSPYEPRTRFQSPEFSCRILFTAMLDSRRALELARRELDFRVQQVERNRERDRSIDPVDPMPGVDAGRVRLMSEQLHQHGMRAVDTWIDWLRALIEKLETEGWGDTPDQEVR